MGSDDSTSPTPLLTPLPIIRPVPLPLRGSYESPSRGAAAREKTMPTARQRGFYSEILDAEMEPASANQLLRAASCGPRSLDLQPLRNRGRHTGSTRC